LFHVGKDARFERRYRTSFSRAKFARVLACAWCMIEFDNGCKEGCLCGGS
jgi:hypothetical protein